MSLDNMWNNLIKGTARECTLASHLTFSDNYTKVTITMPEPGVMIKIVITPFSYNGSLNTFILVNNSGNHLYCTPTGAVEQTIFEAALLSIVSSIHKNIVKHNEKSRKEDVVYTTIKLESMKKELDDMTAGHVKSIHQVWEYEKKLSLLDATSSKYKDAKYGLDCATKLCSAYEKKMSGVSDRMKPLEARLKNENFGMARVTDYIVIREATFSG